MRHLERLQLSPILEPHLTGNDLRKPICNGLRGGRSGGFPVGTAEACGFSRPDYSKAVSEVNFTSQAVTPLTAKASRYFFSWGLHH
jgi:hypothetical protein